MNKLGSFLPGSSGRIRDRVHFPRVGPNGAFVGVLVCEGVLRSNQVTDVAFLWYNVIGCLIVVATGVIVSESRLARVQP